MKKTLPATLAEAEACLLEVDALAHARQMVRSIRDGKITWLGLQLSWFDKGDNRQATKQMLKNLAWHPDGLIDVCNLGRVGWGLAHDALIDLLRDYRHNRVPIPLSLEAYENDVILAAAADPSRRYRRIRGQQKADLLLRDIAVTFLVDDVCWKFGLRPRRNPAAKHTMCGCLIVARAMAEEEGVVALSEPAVAAIWSKYVHIAFGKFPHPSTYPF